MHVTTLPIRQDIVSGHASLDGVDHRGWFVGEFVDLPGDPRRTREVEVKWGLYRAGEERRAWVQNDRATTLSILISGRFRVLYPGREVLLAQQGDYVIHRPRIPHSWFADEDSIVLTIRWPSSETDSTVV